MGFDWMRPASRDRAAAASQRLAMYRREVADRAAIFYRLGFSEAAATARLAANAGWDFETTGRPKELNDKAIAKIVAATYARRPRG